MEYYSAIKKNEIMLFAKILFSILNEVSQTEKETLHSITYIWNLKKKKKDTNELTCRTETDSQTLKTILWLPKGRRGGGGGIGGLGLACAHCGIWNSWTTRTCCISQGTLPNIL